MDQLRLHLSPSPPVVAGRSIDWRTVFLHRTTVTPTLSSHWTGPQSDPGNEGTGQSHVRTIVMPGEDYSHIFYCLRTTYFLSSHPPSSLLLSIVRTLLLETQTVYLRIYSN